jgi:uncharacterized protein (DUF2141 family)
MCESTSGRGSRLLISIGVVMALALVAQPPFAAAGEDGGTLVVDVSGLEHTRGTLVVKLFRAGDAVPKGASYRRVAVRPGSTQPKVEFRGVPYGQYALFLFHDENDNGTLDHNFLGIPSEPMGFSAGFRPSLFSGIPDFDDLKFAFSKAVSTQRIKVE